MRLSGQGPLCSLASPPPASQQRAFIRLGSGCRVAAARGRHPLRRRVAAGVAGPAAADGPEMTASMLLADDLFFKQHDYLFPCQPYRGPTTGGRSRRGSCWRICWPAWARRAWTRCENACCIAPCPAAGWVCTGQTGQRQRAACGTNQDRRANTVIWHPPSGTRRSGRTPGASIRRLCG